MGQKKRSKGSTKSEADMVASDQYTEMLSILQEQVRSSEVTNTSPVWQSRVEKGLAISAVGCCVLSFSVVGLLHLDLIHVTGVTRALGLGSYLLGIATLLLLALFSGAMAVWNVRGKRLMKLFDERCRRDALTLENLARFELTDLRALLQTSTLRSDLIHGRETLLLGFLTKVPLLAAIFVASFAWPMPGEFKVPPPMKWLEQFLPTPLTGGWVALFATLFIAFRYLLFNYRERFSCYTAYLKAAIEYKQSLPATVEVVKTIPSNVAVGSVHDVPVEH